MIRAGLVLAVLLVVLTGGLAGAAEDAREAQARERFAAGDYPAALALFSQVYAGTHDPLLLRNLGRCYQKLKKPDLAIDRFNEYLQRGPDISRQEREEIRGYIREMEALKRAALLTPPGVPSPEEAAISRAPAGPAPPLYLRWWFWPAVGGAAAAVLGGTVWLLSARGGGPDCGGITPCGRI